MVGGTGRISAAVSKLAVEKGIDLYLLNRGTQSEFFPAGATLIQADARNEAEMRTALKGHTFDTVVDWLGFLPEQVEADIRLYSGITKQFIYISSAAAYEKPPAHYVMTEQTRLQNPHWQYARDKIACEEVLFEAYRQKGFPATVVRPSHTYGLASLPMIFPGRRSPYSMVMRMKQGKPIVVPGDGSSLWVVTHNSDFAKGFVGLLGNEKTIGEAYHITSDEVLTWDMIVRTIGCAAGVEPVIRHIATDFIASCHPAVGPELIGDKINSVCFDTSKLKALVPEFVCTTRLADGAKLTMDWFDAHPEMKLADEAWENVCDRLIAAQDAGLAAFHAGI